MRLPHHSALRVALRRAAHQIYDRPLVFEDPLAVRILGKRFREELRRTPTRTDRPFSVASRAFLVARSRFAEDTLAAGVLRGLEQYVLLGAGLDTFAYRNPFPGLSVFEVDLPTTQGWKQELLAENGLTVARNLTLVPMDFERDRLDEKLSKVGLRREKKTLFAWLGVVPYLSAEAFRETLKVISGFPSGSGLVADYLQPRDVLPPLERLALDSLASRVRDAGEPFKLFLTQQEILHEVRAFSSMEDLDSNDLNAMYFLGRQDLLQVRGAGVRLLCAWV